MRLKLKSEIPVNTKSMLPWKAGLSYNPKDQICFGQDGPVTAMDFYNMYPERFEIIDTLSIKIEIVKSLAAQYSYLHAHYRLNEEGMSEKISEITEKIMSKI